jgi:hypothetical protein
VDGWISAMTPSSKARLAGRQLALRPHEKDAVVNRRFPAPSGRAESDLVWIQSHGRASGSLRG